MPEIPRMVRVWGQIPLAATLHTGVVRAKAAAAKAAVRRGRELSRARNIIRTDRAVRSAAVAPPCHRVKVVEPSSQ